MKNRLLVSTCLLVGLGCGIGTSEVRWTEQVKLGDGTFISVERSETYKTSMELGDVRTRWIINSELRLTQSPTSVPLPPLVTPAFPIILDRDPASGIWYAIAHIQDCYRAKDAGRGDLPYFEYHLKDGQWMLTNLSDAHIGMPANLVLSRPPPVTKGAITDAEKTYGNGSPALPDYLRSVVKRVAC